MGGFSNTVLAVIGAVITLAIVAVLVSRNAQTSSVISASGNALASVIKQAVSPVTSGSNLLSSNSIGAIGSLFG